MLFQGGLNFKTVWVIGSLLTWMRAQKTKHTKIYGATSCWFPLSAFGCSQGGEQIDPLRGRSDNAISVFACAFSSKQPPPSTLEDHSPLLPEDLEDLASQLGRVPPIQKKTEEK